MQVTDEVCTVCGKHYETGDSMDPREHENHEYEMCPRCYNADHVVHVKVFISHRMSDSGAQVAYAVGETYVDVYNKDWVSLIRENITKETCVVKMTNTELDKSIEVEKVEDHNMKFLLLEGFALVTD